MLMALVAGEVSGDKLGAGLMTALRVHYPRAQFVGVGGERMRAAGLECLAPLEEFSVMGVVEVVRHLPQLLGLRRRLYRTWSTVPPVVFVGIDAPDFNLGLAAKLHARGVATVQYVSPQVWAWRRWRAAKIARAVDLILTLFPFETAFYQHHQVPVRYVGHPLADAMPLTRARDSARQGLQIPFDQPVLALLPGSRRSEVAALAPVFIDTAHWLGARVPGLRVVVPAATPAIARYLQTELAQRGLQITCAVVTGRSQEVLSAADIGLLASGTATLEALLAQCPMVVAYKMAPATAWLARRLVHLPHFALPNLLAGERVVPEFFQQDATVERLGAALLELWRDAPRRAALQRRFQALHRQLRADADARAAAAIAELLGVS